jgi:signal transduction histidine kinase
MGDAQTLSPRASFSSRVRWWLLSIPISVKVLGIGILVAAIFGTITLFSTTRAMSQSLYRFLEDRTRDSSAWLAVSMERPMTTGDLATVQRKITQVADASVDVRYIIVRDRAGQILAHTFTRAVPEDLARWDGTIPAQGELQVLDSREGLIFHARQPILDGYAGVLELGVTDRRVVGEVSALVRSVLMALFFSVLLGMALGLLLTHLLTKPVHVLVDTTQRLGEGDFDARARVFSDDEIGQLASAFNRMAEALHAFRQQVDEKERARLRLVDGVVQAQEEERKSISRELHDHLGQSLTGLLLTIQSRVSAEQMPAGVRDEIVAQIRRLSGEMHQLAWGLRPPTLDDYGLDSVLSSYVESIAKPSGLKVDYQYTHPEPRERMPARVEVTLYRVAQEALTNTIRHAQATRVSVVVLHRQQDVTLIVEDDGQGFDPERVSPDRLGLTGMRERVALLGGVCTIESKLGNGATVWVRIPVPRDPPCPSAS